MNFESVIRDRRSIRAFKPDPVPHELIAEILDEARWSPSWANTQAWGIYVVTGTTLERLKSAGVSPEAIEAVLITHLHGDHTGGLLTADGKRAFPKAVLRVAQAESDYWLDPKTLASLPEARKGMVAQFKAGIAPYQAAGAYQPFAPSEAPFPGVTAISAHGHTPGHTVYGFGDPKQPFWVVGDIVHVGAVQFSHPEATLIFDWDSGMAAGTRLELWKRAAREGAVLGATHLPFPGLGHVQTEGSAFAWVPLP